MVYDLQSIKAPRMAGSLLKAFTAIMEQDLSSSLLIPKLMNDSGISAFRRLTPDEAPTYFPFITPDSKMLKKKASPPDFSTVLPENEEKQIKDFRFLTVDDYARAYRSGQTTPERVAEAFIAAREASEKGHLPLRAFIASDKNDIMVQARASAERIKKGKPLSVLDGVPIAIKDEMDQRDYPTTVGTKFLGKKKAEADSTVVARLREAGALLIGKTNMHEIGIGVTGFNATHGTPRNPYNPNHYTGGSSSGTATAVAAGFCPVGIGADGGGSIRIPAAFCGLVGLKATFGRVSEHGAAPLCWTVAHIGPIGATTRDVAIAYGLIAGVDQHDQWTVGQPKVSIADWDSDSLKGVKLGVFRPWFSDARSDVVSACDSMLDFYKDRGAEIVEIDIPDLEAIRVAHVVTIASEMATAMERYYSRFRTNFGYDVRINLVLGRHLTNRDYIQAQRIRTKAINTFADLYKNIDAVVTPATGCTAPKIGSDVLPNGESNLSVLSEIMRFAPLANLTGLPAISFPAGYSPDGLPIGIQVIGKPWDEQLLLRCAHLAESHGARIKPKIHYGLLE